MTAQRCLRAFVQQQFPFMATMLGRAPVLPCSRCGEHPRADGQRWCHDCAAQWMRGWRSRHGRLSQRAVRLRAQQFGITLPADFFDVAKLGVQGRR